MDSGDYITKMSYKVKEFVAATLCQVAVLSSGTSIIDCIRIRMQERVPYSDRNSKLLENV